MCEQLTSKDIVAIKSIQGAEQDSLIYLGASSPVGSSNPGRWSRAEDLGLEQWARSPDGRPGDFLAVALNHEPGHLKDYFGRLVCLRQRGHRLTHLGVVRSDSPIAAHEPNGKYDKFIWVEILAMEFAGFEIDVPGVAAHRLPWNIGGGYFTRIEEVVAPADLSSVQAAIWNGFRCIRQPGRFGIARRPAWRP